MAVLAVNALLARLLTPEEYGAYFLILSLVAGASMFALMGLNHAIVRLVAESLGLNQQGRARSAIIHSMLLVAVGGLFVMSILGFGGGEWLAISLLNSPLIAGAMGLILIWIVALAYQVLSAEIFRGYHDIRLASVFGGLLSALLTAMVFTFLLIWQGHSNLEQTITFAIGATIVSVLIAGVCVFRKIGHLESWNKFAIKDVLQVSMPLLAPNITMFILAHADIWILGAFRPQATVAVYGSASRLMQLVPLPLLIVNAVLLPIIAEMHAQSKKVALQETLQATATMAMIPAAVMFALFVFFGRPLLGIIYGDFYRDGYVILIVLGVGQLAYAWTGSCGYTLMMTGQQRLMMYISLVAGLIVLGLGILLVGPYGASGIATATAIGLVAQAIAMWLGVRWTIGIWTHVSIRKIRELLVLINSGSWRAFRPRERG